MQVVLQRVRQAAVRVDPLTGDPATRSPSFARAHGGKLELLARDGGGLVARLSLRSG